ncbi:MAG: tRNA pseudouridine(54/55) synthase Pus10 [Desulfurococcaceae archaeon TW002]
MFRLSNELLDKVFRALHNYPLCDRCLGRLFAKYGLGLSNSERGKALKILLAMTIHKELSSSESVLSKEDLMRMAENGGSPISDLVQYYVGPVNVKKCHICGNKLDVLINELTVKCLDLLKNRDFKSLLVGVEKNSTYEEKEKEVVSVLSVDSWESIRREIKREVGKRLHLITSTEPNFKEPDVLLVLNLDTGEVKIRSSQIFLKGYYLKLGRHISQKWWYSKDGGLRYKASVEGVAEKLARVFLSDGILIHAAGREDSDARMLGSGRPLIIEVVNPRKREFRLEEVNDALLDEWVKIRILTTSSSKELEEVKKARKPKMYRVVVYVPEGIEEEELKRIEEGLSNSVVHQRTPKRILKRKKDVLRHRKIHMLVARMLSKYLIELVILCESGLYVKEVITGDEDRTNPSVSGLLGKEAYSVFLDVLEYVKD